MIQSAPAASIATPADVAAAVRRHLPEPVAAAITADTTWDRTARELADIYGDNLDALTTSLANLAVRLERESANAHWITHQAAAPARWLYTNLAWR